MPIPNSFLRNAAHGNFAARHISTDLLIIDPPAPLSGNIIITKTKFDNAAVQTKVITITNTNESFRARTGPNRSPLMLAHDLASPLSLTTRRRVLCRGGEGDTARRAHMHSHIVTRWVGVRLSC